MRYTYLTLFSLAVLVAMCACGESTSSGNITPSGTQATGAVTPASTQNTSATPQTPPPLPSSTRTPQGLPLDTNSSHYGPADTIIVTFTNTSSIPLYAWDTRASCTIFGLEMLTQGQWQPAPVARCSLGRPAFMITLAPGQKYNAHIQAKTPGLNTAVFPVGMYRVTLLYTATPAVQTATTQVVSATFQVQT